MPYPHTTAQATTHPQAQLPAIDRLFSALNPLPALLLARASTLACLAINHVLRLEPTVQAYLKPHAGRVVLLRWQSLALAPAGEQALRIDDDLSISPCVESNPNKVDVTISIQSGIVSASADERLRFVRLEGDVFLAQDLSRLAKDLRWDVEHDLASVLGDAPAYWLMSNAKKAAPLLQAVQGAIAALVAKVEGLNPAHRNHAAQTGQA